MRPAHTPSSVKGSISKCVVSLRRRKKKWNDTNQEEVFPFFNMSAKSCHSLANHVLIKGDLTIILLVDIQVLHQALVQEILKGPGVKKSEFQKWSNQDDKLYPTKIWSSNTKNYLQTHICSLSWLPASPVALRQIFNVFVFYHRLPLLHYDVRSNGGKKTAEYCQNNNESISIFIVKLHT